MDIIYYDSEEFEKGLCSDAFVMKNMKPIPAGTSIFSMPDTEKNRKWKSLAVNPFPTIRIFSIVSSPHLTNTRFIHLNFVLSSDSFSNCILNSGAIHEANSQAIIG